MRLNRLAEAVILLSGVYVVSGFERWVRNYSCEWGVSFFCSFPLDKWQDNILNSVMPLPHTPRLCHRSFTDFTFFNRHGWSFANCYDMLYKPADTTIKFHIACCWESVNHTKYHVHFYNNRDYRCYRRCHVKLDNRLQTCQNFFKHWVLLEDRHMLHPFKVTVVHRLHGRSWSKT
jgi:hypothetical protein